MAVDTGPIEYVVRNQARLHLHYPVLCTPWFVDLAKANLRELGKPSPDDADNIRELKVAYSTLPSSLEALSHSAWALTDWALSKTDPVDLLGPRTFAAVELLESILDKRHSLSLVPSFLVACIRNSVMASKKKPTAPPSPLHDPETGSLDEVFGLFDLARVLWGSNGWADNTRTTSASAMVGSVLMATVWLVVRQTLALEFYIPPGSVVRRKDWKGRATQSLVDKDIAIPNPYRAAGQSLLCLRYEIACDLAETLLDAAHLARSERQVDARDDLGTPEDPLPHKRVDKFDMLLILGNHDDSAFARQTTLASIRQDTLSLARSVATNAAFRRLCLGNEIRDFEQIDIDCLQGVLEVRFLHLIFAYPPHPFTFLRFKNIVSHALMRSDLDDVDAEDLLPVVTPGPVSSLFVSCTFTPMISHYRTLIHIVVALSS